MGMGRKLALGTLLGALLLTGCSDDNSSNPPITGGPTLAPPIAVNDSFNSLANAQVSPAAATGVLANDTPNTGTIVSHTDPSHGTVTLNADGSFTYTPVTGYVGTDTFTYTLQNSGGTATATVTITISGAAFFVNNQASAGGDGSQAHPFQTLAQAAVGANGVTGATIFVARGDGTTTGLNTAITLAGGQTLQGLDAANPPTLTGPVVMTQNNALSALNFSVVSGTAVNASGAINGTISDISVVNATNKAVSLVNATGTWTVANSNFVNIGNGTIDGSASSGILNWSVSSCTFTNSTFVSVIGNTTQTASQNLTVEACTFNQGQNSDIGGLISGNVARYVLTNNTIQSSGIQGSGIDLEASGNLIFSTSISGNNITNCFGNGILLDVFGNSQAKLRFTNNRTIGNQQFGFNIVNSGGGSIGAVFTSNFSDSFGLTQGGGLFQVEDLADFSTNNAGILIKTNVIGDAAAGSLGIP